MSDITRADLFDAFNHAVARIHEWDGAGVEAKLAAFGLQIDDVVDLLRDRWEQHQPLADPEQPHLLFVQGFTEGLITGLQLSRREGVDAHE